MIDIKAKAKPLYVILLALVLISTTTIIAGTTINIGNPQLISKISNKNRK